MTKLLIFTLYILSLCLPLPTLASDNRNSYQNVATMGNKMPINRRSRTLDQVSPTSQPSSNPTSQPSSNPSLDPTSQPTSYPSAQPSSYPSLAPTGQPSSHPTEQPISMPTKSPSSQPSEQPNTEPSSQPSSKPTQQPIASPTSEPTSQPTSEPSQQPISIPSSRPSSQPSTQPTSIPSRQPSAIPTDQPSGSPSSKPSSKPSNLPSSRPSKRPSSQPSTRPSSHPSAKPSTQPSVRPSSQPTRQPSSRPTSRPSCQPSSQPSSEPTSQPSTHPSSLPSSKPTSKPTSQPTSKPQSEPTARPSRQPTNQPTSRPSGQPTSHPSSQPSCQPTTQPSVHPTNRPSAKPTNQPSSQPTRQPSSQPSDMPSRQPTAQPTGLPSSQPSSKPSVQPSSQPSSHPSPQPTSHPTQKPSSQPTIQPTSQPLSRPTFKPSSQPTSKPSSRPSSRPTSKPNSRPSSRPSARPSSQPSSQPSSRPTQPSSQPTGQPSRQPSGKPSSRPTFKPTGQPSAQPTAHPSCQPTSQPSSRPTGQPTRRPTGQPSRQPTSQPTGQPSAQPTRRPSAQPTSQPSMQPSSQPSSRPSTHPSTQPSSKPSSQPSSVPSTQPTSQPTMQPSLQPTSQPSRQPTGQPTSGPSLQPSSQPTMQPTDQPTSRPSVQPSSQPSSRPTMQPSSQPSRRPSGQPTNQPSGQPSTVPSGQPTVRPTTSRPTSVPTAGPSKYPTTTRPTNDGETNAPTRYPTSQPTYNLRSYLSFQMYKDYLSNSSYWAALPSSLTYSTYFYKGVTVQGSCPSWNSFVEQQFNLPYDDITYTRVNAWFSIYDYLSKTYRNVNASCNNPNSVRDLAKSMILGTEYEVNCQDYSWRVFNCNNRRVFCVNCKKICVKTEACPGRSWIINPCETCTTHAAMGGIVNFEYKTSLSYPPISSLNVSLITNTTVDIAYTISNAGIIRCAAFPQTFSLSSTYDIYKAGIYQVVNSSSSFSGGVKISGLRPSIQYKVLCYTESFSKQIMPLAESASVLFLTSCCKMSYFTADLVKFTPQDLVDKSITLSLSSSPTSLYSVDLKSSSVPCNNLLTASSSILSISPSRLTFATNAVLLDKSFSIKGNPGCYIIYAQGRGDDSYLNGTINVEILNSSSIAILAPLPLYARLDSSSSYVFLGFNGSTNKPYQDDVSTIFPCSMILRHRLVSDWQCIWMNDTTLRIGLGMKSTLNVGETITVIGGKISYKCFSSLIICSSYPTLMSANLTVLVPLFSFSPVASLTSQKLSLYCDDLYLDATESNGNGGRPWQDIKWSVSGDLSLSNLTILNTYMNTYYSDISDVMVVPNSVLFLSYQPGNIIFTLTITNFLGLTSSVSNTVNFQYSPLLVPRLTIAGPPIVQLKRSSSLLLFANVTIPTCSNRIYNQTLTYSWNVFISKQLIAMQSLSSDPRYFRLAPYTLNTTTYTVQVKIILHERTPAATVTTSSVSVVVGTTGVKSIILGGSTQVVSSNNDYYLDGRNSYDIDYPEQNQYLQYYWTCFMGSPVYGADCASSIFPNNRSYWKVPVDLFIEGTYLISLRVQNSYGSYDSSALNLTVVNDDAPAVRINNLLSAKQNPMDKLVLSGLIVTSELATAAWNSSQLLPLQNYAATPLRTAIGINSNGATFILSILPGTFSAGLDYSFSLSSFYSSNYIVASSSLSVSINQAPAGGVLSVSPSQGTAITTMFTLSSLLWTDDSADYPLQCSFAYYVSDPTFAYLLRGKNNKFVLYSPLGQGLRANSYQLTVLTNVSDIYGATSSAIENATVIPIQSTFVSTATAIAIDATNQLIDRAKILSNPDLIIQALATSVRSINGVDCAVSKPCDQINREGCSNTAKTCGPCLAGFDGVLGDSNLPCNLTQSFRGVGDSCLSNSSCITGLCVSGKCIDVAKSCPNNCYNRGQCQFKDANGESISFCSNTDYSCTATCSCNLGRYGRDCGVTVLQFNQVTSYRSVMCSNMLASMSYQEVNIDTVRSRAKIAADILLDGTMITYSTLYNCSTVLIRTVNEYPDLACDATVSSTITAAYSKVLEYFSNNRSTAVTYSDLLSNMLDSITTFKLSCQSLLVANENPTEFLTAYIRSTSYVADTTLSNGDITLALPLTTAERLSGKSQAILTFRHNTEQDVGVTILQYPTNPRNLHSNSSIIDLVFSDTSSRNTIGTSGGTSRRLQSNSSNVDYPFTIVVPNPYPINYTAYDNYRIILTCDHYSEEDYILSTTCSMNQEVNVTCPAGNKGNYTVVCPARRTLPVCSLSNGIEFVAASQCQLVAFTSMNTTCYCTPSGATSSENHRFLQSSGLSSIQIATNVDLFIDPVVIIFDSWPSKLSVVQNGVIMLTTSICMGFFLLGLFFFVRWDYKEQHQIKKVSNKYMTKYYDPNSNKMNVVESTVEKKAEDIEDRLDRRYATQNKSIVRTIKTFFQRILPRDFHPLPWKEVFWHRLLIEHSYLGLGTAYNEQTGLRSTRWTVSMCKLLTFLSVNTVLSSLLYADNGQCDNNLTEQSCDFETDLFHIYKTCEWTPDNENCIFKRPSITFFTIIVYLLIVMIAAAPINALVEVLIKRLFKLIQHLIDDQTNKLVVPLETDLINEDGTLKEYWHQADELHDVQDMPNKLLKSARLRKMHQEIDFALPSLEAELLLQAQYRRFEVVKRSELTVISHPEYHLKNRKLCWTDTSMHARYHMCFANAPSLSRFLDVKRRQADFIRLKLEKLYEEQDKDTMLMQYFLIHCFQGYERNIVARYLIGSVRMQSKTKFEVYFTYLSVLLLPIIYIGLIYLIMYLNLDIGSRATDMWLLVVFISLIEDILIVQPYRILIKWNIYTLPIKTDVYKLCQALEKRYVAIINRRAGNMTDLHGVVQHFNPACRTARLFPNLPIARLLISLNDYDVPFFSLSSNSLGQYNYFANLWSALFLAFSSLPTSMQDTAVELVGIGALNLLVIGFYLLGQMSLGIAIGVAAAIVFLFVLWDSGIVKKFYPYKVHKRTRRAIRYDIPNILSTREKNELNEDGESRKIYKTSMKIVEPNEFTQLKNNLTRGLRETRLHREINRHTNVIPLRREKSSDMSPAQLSNSNMLNVQGRVEKEDRREMFDLEFGEDTAYKSDTEFNKEEVALYDSPPSSPDGGLPVYPAPSAIPPQKSVINVMKEDPRKNSNNKPILDPTPSPAPRDPYTVQVKPDRALDSQKAREIEVEEAKHRAIEKSKKRVSGNNNSNMSSSKRAEVTILPLGESLTKPLAPAPASAPASSSAPAPVLSALSLPSASIVMESVSEAEGRLPAPSNNSPPAVPPQESDADDAALRRQRRQLRRQQRASSRNSERRVGGDSFTDAPSAPYSPFRGGSGGGEWGGQGQLGRAESRNQFPSWH